MATASSNPVPNPTPAAPPLAARTGDRWRVAAMIVGALLGVLVLVGTIGDFASYSGGQLLLVVLLDLGVGALYLGGVWSLVGPRDDNRRALVLFGLAVVAGVVTVLAEGFLQALVGTGAGGIAIAVAGLAIAAVPWFLLVMRSRVATR